MESIIWAALGMGYSLIALAIETYKHKNDRPFKGQNKHTQRNYDYD